MIVATSATVRNLTSLSGVTSAAIDCPLLADRCALARFRRTSHARLQRKSCFEKGKPHEPAQFGRHRLACHSISQLWRNGQNDVTGAPTAQSGAGKRLL